MDDFLPPIVPKVENETDDFNFESASYALQNNKDYQMLLRALVKLQAQKIQAVKGLEELHETREAILKDPFSFVQSLQNGENLNLPRPIDIQEVPEIEWEKYDIQSIIQTLRPTTRRLTKKNNNDNSTSNTNEVTESHDGSSAQDGVKGNSRNELEKSETFNLQWTPEEQRKLEELLIKYPNEPMAARRWAKISKELGNRSALQVQSRVQKYFIALEKAGLPVPGRKPKKAVLGAWRLRNTMTRKRGPIHPSFKTYMKAFDFETSAKEANDTNDGTNGAVGSFTVKEQDLSDEEDISEELKDTKEYQELLSLKRAKKLKLEEMRTGETLHYGYKCDGCSSNPIKGTRWHCTDCPQSPGVDLCEYCAKNFINDSHLSSHRMNPIKALSLRDTAKFHQST